MSDISIELTWFDLLLAAPVFGWPGLILGGALGALLWRKRRIAGAILGAILGCIVWFGAGFVFKLL